MKNWKCVLWLCWFAIPVLGQDAFFSDYRMAPLELNPALTGAFADGLIRLNIKHRNQWASFLDEGGFQTYYAGADAQLCLSKKDFIGLGLSATVDEAGRFPLQRVSGMLSFAYYRTLSSNSRTSSFLSLGFESGYSTYQLKEGDFYFDEQFDDPTILDEISEQLTDHLFTTGAGLFFAREGRDFREWTFRLSLAARHLNRPELHLFTTSPDGSQNLNWLVRAYALLAVPTGYKHSAILLTGNAIQQKPHLQYGFGVGYARELKADEIELSFLATPRIVRNESSSFVPEAINISFQLDLFNYSIGLGYDANISSLARTSRGAGAFELGLAYRICQRKCNLVICPGM